MAVIGIETRVAARPEVLFGLSLDVDAHIEGAAGTDERAVAGVTSGRMTLGDTVTWEARHFGIRFRMTVKITAMDEPRSFTDEMVEGPFRRMVHRHEFEAVEGGTLMRDRFEFASPGWILGRLVDALVLKRHLRRFLVARNAHLKRRAEEVRRA